MAVKPETRVTVAPATRRRSALAALAWAGIVAPVLFTATFLAQEALRRDEFSPVAQPVSALEVGPYGWVQQVNFVVLGLLTMAHAIGLHEGCVQCAADGPDLCCSFSPECVTWWLARSPGAKTLPALPTHRPLTLSGE